jgi:predicted outer membrane lipoprotein
VKPTRPRGLLAVALVVSVFANLVVRLAYGSLPAFPLLAGATFGVLGIAEAIAGNMLRARIRRRPGYRPVQPLVAARAVLVAKASALAGAIMAGVWGGLLAHVLPKASEATAAASDSLAAGVGLACALGLVGGALWLEHCCRTPDDPQDESDGTPRE